MTQERQHQSSDINYRAFVLSCQQISQRNQDVFRYAKSDAPPSVQHKSGALVRSHPKRRIYLRIAPLIKESTRNVNRNTISVDFQNPQGQKVWRDDIDKALLHKSREGFIL